MTSPLLSSDVCALTKSDVMQVGFLLWQSIAISLTLTAMSERMWWEAKGHGAYLRERWTLKTGTSDYSGKVNGNVNYRKPRNH